MAKPHDPSGNRKVKPEHNVLVHGSIQAYPPPEVTQAQEAERKEDAATRTAERKIDIGRESHKVWLERLTLAAVIVYAFITYWQGTLTRKSIDNNSKQFQIDQRPYLWTTNTKPQITITEGQKMWANIEIVDFGKAPALKVRAGGIIFIGPTAKNDADVWFNGLVDKLFTDPDQSELVIPPGIPSVFQSEPKPSPGKSGTGKRESLPEATPSGGFGGGGYVTIMSEKPLTQPQVDYILDTDESAVIAMRLQYFDAFGNRYWSNVCMSRYISGAIPNCPHHNEMH